MNNKNKSLFKAIMPWLVVIILLSSLVPLLNTGKSSAVNYNEFVSILDKQKVTEMTVMPGIYVTSVEGKYTKNEKGKDVTYAFKTNVPQTDEELNSLMQLLEDKGIKVSVLDAKSENKIYEHFLAKNKNKTIVFVTHRLSAVKYADKILFLQNGKVQGFDSHENLMKTNIDYRNMYNLQKEAYI